MATVQELRSNIVQALLRCESTAALEKALLAERLREATAAELAELQKVASRRAGFRERAKSISARVEQQRAAVRAFLEARDLATAALDEAKVKVEALQRLQFASFVYPKATDYWVEVGDIPQGYLPDGLTLDALASDLVPGTDLTAEALKRLQACRDLLASAVAQPVSLPHLLPDEVTV